MVRDIRNLELSFGEEAIKIEDSVKIAREKLERSIATLKDLPAGHVITLADIHLLSPGDGVQWNDREKLLGKALTAALPKNEIVYLNNIS
jgi:sialic acid synthase